MRYEPFQGSNIFQSFTQGCRWRSNPGLELANAFGVNPGLELVNAFGVLVGEQEHGEGGEPVFTCVVAARDVSEGGGGVFLC